MSPRLLVLVVVLLSALAVSDASVGPLLQALLQPAQPIITGFKGCGSSLATACRAGNYLQLNGENFPTLWPGMNTVSIAGPSGTRYPCTFSYANYAYLANCAVPDVQAADRGVALTVRIANATLALTSNDFPGVYVTGELRVDSITGCSGSVRGTPTDCQVGDIITVAGNGFGYAPQGDSNVFQVWVANALLQVVEVVSNEVLTGILPVPSYSFTTQLSIYAGALAPQAFASAPLSYAPFPVITLLNAVSGCDGSKGSQLINCHAGDIIEVGGVAPGFDGQLVQITIGSQYDCSLVSFNATRTGIKCALPQVSSSDLGVTLPITVVMEETGAGNAFSGITFSA